MRNQRGAAFMVMLSIMIIGVITVLVGALSKATLQTARNEKSSDMLALSKEILVGYAVNGTGGGQRPGDLPYPDRLLASETPSNYDGNTDSCPTLQTAPTPTGCLGRLPWSTPLFLSMTSPSENDPTGLMPWYAVSANMVDPAGVTMNSELLNTAPHTWLTVRDMKGNVLSNRVAFILAIPGPVLPGLSRPLSTSQGGPGLMGANQYLDSITVPATCTAPCVPGTYSNADADDSFIMGDEHRWIDDPSNPGHQIEDASYNFNDKLIYVTIDELMPLIEKRIAREVKNCLDSYAAVSANKYPWAAPISPLAYTSVTNTKFGRIPDVPVITTVNINIQSLFNALAAVEAARINCISSDNATNTNAMINAGIALVAIANTVASTQPTTPAIPGSVTSNAITAGQRAQDTSPTRCERVENGTSILLENAQAATNTALSGITVNVPEDAAMLATWPVGCFVSGNMADYWPDWQRLVLYQVSDSYRPNGAAASCAGTCLSVNGSGNPNAGSGTYRASIALAGKKLGTQTRVTEAIDQYLDGTANQTAPSNLIFETSRPADTGYSAVNDLVLCLDGKVNCK